MPVPAQVRLIIGNDDEMEHSGDDAQLTSGAGVFLACRVWLHRRDGHPEKIAHARTATIATSAMTIAAMSAVLFSWSRKGLKPTVAR